MTEPKQYFKNEDKPTITLERARELLNDYETPDDQLQDTLLHIQQYCEMIYATFQQMKKKQQADCPQNDNIRYLDFGEQTQKAA